MAPFFDTLALRASQIDSYLCVGLDPHRAQNAAEAERICVDIIHATAQYACCFKPNSAFFEAHGGPGFVALRRVISAAQAHGKP